jgi:TRAP-type C4-dicarboxylate transport system permease small subunit
MGISRRVLGPLMTACGVVSAVGFGLLAGIVSLDVLTRNLQLAQWSWLNEVTEYILTISTFLGAPWLLHHNGHVNIDILLRAMPRHLANATIRLADAIGLGICAVLLYESLRVTIDSQRLGSLVFKNLIFPEWYLMVPVVICFALCTLEFVLRFFDERRAP